MDLFLHSYVLTHNIIKYTVILQYTDCKKEILHRIYVQKHIFLVSSVVHIPKTPYFCTVFFMVLDLRLSKDWVVGMTTFLFYSRYHSRNNRFRLS